MLDPWNWSSDDGELFHGLWEQNLAPLQALLITESSSHPLDVLFLSRSLFDADIFSLLSSLICCKEPIMSD